MEHDDLNWQDDLLYPGWTVRGKDPIRHKVRTECEDWDFTGVLGRRRMDLVAESFSPELMVQTIVMWREGPARFQTTRGFSGKPIASKTFKEAIALHNLHAAPIIAQLDEIDAYTDAYGSSLLDGIL
jgi:hypothetical protein